MNHDTFATIWQDAVTHSETTLLVKSDEYGTSEDVLHNIRQSAVLEQTTLRASVGGKLSTAIVKIYDMIREDELAPVEAWDNKIGEAINYLMLLKAAAIDEHKSQRPPASAETVPATTYDNYETD